MLLFDGARMTITTVADLLAAFLEKERQILDEHPVTHGPTIGAMYEGLTKDALTQSLPVANLTVSSGFVIDAEGKQSKQIDCILALGEGERIPRTDARIHRVEDIIATVSIKKTLYGEDLQEGYENLRSVYERPLAPGTAVPRVALRAFRQITGVAADREIDVPEEHKVLWHILRVDAASPARIVFGFHGYTSEVELRRGVRKALDVMVGKPGYGPMSLPHLIVNRHAVVVKANGMPWALPMEENRWRLLLSSDTLTPARAFLEIIWSRLNYRGLATAEIFGDDMDCDCFHPLVDAECVGAGWVYQVTGASVPPDLRGVPPRQWAPTELTDTQGILMLFMQKNGELDLTALPAGFPPREQVTRDLLVMQHDGLSACDATRQRFHLVQGVAVVFAPDGRVLAGDDSSGRLRRWVGKLIGNKA